MRSLITFILTIVTISLSAQSGVVEGYVRNKLNNQAIDFANVFLEGTTTGVYTDEKGFYRIENIKPGYYNISASFLGFEKATFFEIEVTNNKKVQLDFGLSEDNQVLEAVEVKAKAFRKVEESPVSLRTINATEINRNPGGNRDISKVLQSLPGVASSVSFRNDIIIRGGAPNENRFFIEGIEVPNINHFATQGSSGGPVGMINVNFIREVDFYSGAFPVSKGNALSSVIDFKFKEGSKEKIGSSVLVGSSDAAFTVEGPTGKNSSLLFSFRQSYLQFLFKAIGLPFLPTYNDISFKEQININDKNKLTIIGLGALDQFRLNESVNDGITDQEQLDRNNYILGYLPINEQWNYTVGAKLTRFREKGYQLFIASRNHLNNSAFKYLNNDETLDKTFDYQSQEIENKFRFEQHGKWKGWKTQFGAGFQRVGYTNATQQTIFVNNEFLNIDFTSELYFNRYSLFGQASKDFLDKRLNLSLGLRADAADYSSDMMDIINQLSPRLSLSYAINEKLSWNSNIGQYQQLPSYTILGHRDNAGNLVNKQNGVKYIQAQHLVSGFEYYTNESTKFSIEGFYKLYQNYPFQLSDSITLANLGADFGVIGNEPIESTAEGRAYGLEFLIQKKLSKTFYGILAYTLVRSEFETKDGTLSPSAWDNGQILNLTGGMRLKRNWEIGVKFRYSGGSPYTPFDVETSSIKGVWDLYRQPLLDYNQLNANRFDGFHSMDLRIDKRWYGEKVLWNVYLDVQNLYNAQFEGQGYYNTIQNPDGTLMENPNDPSRYALEFIRDVSGNRLPSIGLLVEF